MHSLSTELRNTYTHTHVHYRPWPDMYAELKHRITKHIHRCWWIGQVLGWFIPCPQKECHKNKLDFAPATRSSLYAYVHGAPDIEAAGQICSESQKKLQLHPRACFSKTRLRTLEPWTKKSMLSATEPKLNEANPTKCLLSTPPPTDSQQTFVPLDVAVCWRPAQFVARTLAKIVVSQGSAMPSVVQVVFEPTGWKV